MTDRLIEDLTLKEGYINGKPTTITLERIINETNGNWFLFVSFLQMIK